MSFIETPQFPTDISYGVTGGPVFQTDIARVDNGTEYRNQVWSQPLYRYDASHAARLKTTYDALRDFFYAMQGRTHGFRFKDWADYSATASEGVFATIDSTHFQMYKRYTSGSTTYNRKIVKPAGTITVTGGTSPATASTTGIVTVSSGTPTAWAGEFDVPCRFDIDNLPSEIITRSGSSFVMGWSGIPIVGLRL